MDIVTPINHIVDQLRHHPTKRYGTRSISSIDGIVIHCSGTVTGRAASFARYHVDNLGWPGIGYAIVIDADGIHQTQELTTISYHLSLHNTHKIGICHTGNFDLRPPTDQEYWNYVQAVIHIDRMIGKQLPVTYHNDYTDKKTCPGLLFDKAYFAHHLEEMRQILS